MQNRLLIQTQFLESIKVNVTADILKSRSEEEDIATLSRNSTAQWCGRMTLLFWRLGVSSNTINGMILGSITPYNKKEVKLVSGLHLIPYFYLHLCSFLSHSFCLFYGFIVPKWVSAMSRYFLLHYYWVNCGFPYGDVDANLRPTVTCHGFQTKGGFLGRKPRTKWRKKHGYSNRATVEFRIIYEAS